MAKALREEDGSSRGSLPGSGSVRETFAWSDPKMRGASEASAEGGTRGGTIPKGGSPAAMPRRV
jgi:hypothetical protein